MMIDFSILEHAVSHPTSRVGKFLGLISGECDDLTLSRLAATSAATTRQHFGRTMRLFAPLYVSNDCVNSCLYCGFARRNDIPRRSLTLPEVLEEASILLKNGFRNLLIVSSENNKAVSSDYLVNICKALSADFPEIAVEVAPLETEVYARLSEVGTDGLTVFQETYLPDLYSEMHPFGPKRNYLWRLQAPERAYSGGFRRLGIGALLGLTHWREETLLLAAHLDYLMRECWRASISLSFPRLRPAAGAFNPPHPVSDRDFIRLVCAFRIAFPQVGIVISTRESPALRDTLAPLGVTMMSAGAKTNPGGYRDAHCGSGKSTPAETQFNVSDERSPEEVTAQLRRLGLEPVRKDWQREK